MSKATLSGSVGGKMLALALLLFANSGAAARTLVEVEHQTKSGCKIVIHENALLSESDRKFSSLTWTGKCKNGFADGPGTVAGKRKGMEIKGAATFTRGRPDGDGTYEIVSDTGDRETFKGKFANGLRTGEGQQTVIKSGQSPATYTGNFVAGLPHGQGKIEKGGTTYVGEFSEGRPTGIGTITFPNRNTYTGEVRDGKPYGKGKLTNPNGTTIEAVFTPDRLPSFGQMRTASGFTYEGELEKLKPSGRGKLTGPKSTYTGEFRDGKPNGSGILETTDGQKIEVIATDGKMQRRTQEQQKSAASQPEKEEEDEGLDWLSILGAIGRGIQANDEAERRRKDAEILNKHHSPGFLKGERTSGFNKICIYDDMGSDRVITIGATDLCPLH